MKHELKTINPYFQEVWNGNKTFEVRKNDRNFKRGDAVVLKEYDYENDCFSGREIIGEISYVLEKFAIIPEPYVVFSLFIYGKNEPKNDFV